MDNGSEQVRQVLLLVDKEIELGREHGMSWQTLDVLEKAQAELLNYQAMIGRVQVVRQALATGLGISPFPDPDAA